MPGERLYLRDAWKLSFTAKLVAVEGDKVRLNETYFYPTSGGQPNDLGTLTLETPDGPKTLEVIDVTETTDGSHGVWHHLGETPEALVVGSTVSGSIDGARRFDHMQQHSGQHLMSALLEKMFNLRTVCVHIGSTQATMDLDGVFSEDANIRRLEHAFATMVFQNRKVSVSFDEITDEETRKKKGPILRLITIGGDAESDKMTDEELSRDAAFFAKLGLPELQRQPEPTAGTFTPYDDGSSGVSPVVAAGVASSLKEATCFTSTPFDVNPCCGTHVSRTGMIGPLLIHSSAKMRGGSRLTVTFGHRAIRQRQLMGAALNELNLSLKAPPTEMPALVAAMVEKNKILKKERDSFFGQLAQLKFEQALKDAMGDGTSDPNVAGDGVSDGATVKPVPFILLEPTADYAMELADTFSRLCSVQDLRVAFAFLQPPNKGSRKLVLAAGRLAGLSAGAVLKKLAAAHGGRGGGSPVLASGSIVDDTVTLEDVKQALLTGV